MKKVIAIIVFGLLWCNTAQSNQIIKVSCSNLISEAKDYHLNRLEFTINPSEKSIYANLISTRDGKKYEYKEYLSIVSWNDTFVVYSYYDGEEKFQFDYSEYPFIESSYDTSKKHVTCKLKGESKKIKIASMIDDTKDTCKSLGFNEGTDKFSDCALKLYSQSVELAAKNNQQIVIQNQGSTSSSGSNVMTIYDPVRDSNALIKRGQGLINGTCTLANLSTC
tara:strand:+ start:8 stop:673 length:666 start_codon:yes stop_codon:yes gene_type:complete